MDIVRYEQRLRRAMMHSSVAELDELLSNELIFTNQDGVRISKADDLSAHSSGLLKINKLDHRGAPKLRDLGDLIVVCVDTELAGSFDGQPFEGIFAYTRLWHRKGQRWEVAAAHCSPVVHRG
ncbi:nuclear transport factor 2 family protein [Aquamicrobium sp.]|uniref:nuclear transport factor 2 family protein n=1 Tax=Aquamicrobium sp. TaxID=1872579 RepID=UPI0025874F75|nr:nuclear transport factor 2 family protein [Aquamicrobium sp.]MCK9549755.1 nuclear transport factor 2 family protein [Aquamicrobium sp.]